MKAALFGRVKWTVGDRRLAAPQGIGAHGLTLRRRSSIRVGPRPSRRSRPNTPESHVTANQIFSGLEPSEAHEIFESLHEASKPAYKGTMQATASRRKLRPVFLERKTRVDRHAWMQNALAAPTNEDLAIEVLQNWLLSAHREMLGEFLDACGIVHQEGLIDDIPPQPPREKVDAAVEAICAKYSPATVKVYLHLFQPQDAQAWPDLDALLLIDPRLALKSK